MRNENNLQPGHGLTRCTRGDRMRMKRDVEPMKIEVYNDQDPTRDREFTWV